MDIFVHYCPVKNYTDCHNYYRKEPPLTNSMSNKKSIKKQIDKSFFLKIVHEKGYTINSLGIDPSIDRCPKTIHRYLSLGEMPIDLLDRIGKLLDVDPEYLSGELERRLLCQDNVTSEQKTTLERLWRITSRFPYNKYEVLNLDYKRYLLDTLKIFNISSEQFLKLDKHTQKHLQSALATSIGNVIIQFFNLDSQGKKLDSNMLTDGQILLSAGDWLY